jgi:hypothetical protein
MKLRIITFIFLVTGVIPLMADDPVRFTASAPSTVIVDKPFQLVYTVNATGKDLRVPEINNFEILAGPFESRSSSYQVINGKATSSVSITYTYTLLASKTGTYTISPASIIVGGDKYTTNTLTIKVLPADDASASKQNQQSQSSGASSKAVSDDEVFIRTSLSKADVYEQEAVLLTYKLYTLVDVVSVNNKKMPDFQGFLKQDIEQSQNKQFSYENYNGRNYGTVVLYQVLLYPQRSGEIMIDRANFEAIIRVQNRAAIRSIFDDFFDSYTNVSRTILAPSVRINVKALPAGKPAAFSGTVGDFTLSSTISSQKVSANDAITMKVVISGNGNMKLIKNPEIKFPDGFDVYDPKVVNNFKTTANGISGTKTIEYMVIPRHQGKYSIPSAEFSYFDIQSKSYKTLRTPDYNIEVLKGTGSDNQIVSGNFTGKEDIKQLGKDIRYIFTGNVRFTKTSRFIFGSTFGWLLYLIPLLISLILFFIFRKTIRDNANIEYVKNKKANKVAVKRLKHAGKLLNEGKKESFYEEVLKAVWTYLSDKLNIPVAMLNKGNVVAELSKKNIDAELINQLTEILNTCEFARYAPSRGQEEMGNLYNDTIKVISNLEEELNKR